MFRHARKILPTSSCLMLFNAMVLLLFDYCVVVWDSCGVCSKTYLDKLYRRTACIIEGRPVDVLELHTILGWPNLQACWNYLKCTMVFKSIHGIAPSYLLSEFRHGHQIHAYNTRQRDQLRLPPARTTKYQGSFRFSGTRAFNTLPRNITTLHELNTFKINVKRHFKR